ncbi:hypothetical protein CAP36_14165 [Chitinophagaceae bacterium IBVUCB2]|nr:hypothetical protein CAP36_14165 [Chitinophagaceae bacterium IBVUCB2]
MAQKKLEELNTEFLSSLEEYLKSKGEIKEEDQQKIHTAKEELQAAWIKIREVLMVLERIEI